MEQKETYKKLAAAIIVAVIAGYGVYSEMDPEDIMVLISGFLVFIFGQGLSDFRKGAARIEAAAKNGGTPQAPARSERND